MRRREDRRRALMLSDRSKDMEDEEKVAAQNVIWYEGTSRDGHGKNADLSRDSLPELRLSWCGSAATSAQLVQRISKSSRPHFPNSLILAVWYTARPQQCHKEDSGHFPNSYAHHVNDAQPLPIGAHHSGPSVPPFQQKPEAEMRWNRCWRSHRVDLGASQRT